MDELLDIKFQKPGYIEIFRYFYVPEEVYRAFLAAPSKGQFFTKNIRPKYRFLKLFNHHVCGSWQIGPVTPPNPRGY